MGTRNIGTAVERTSIDDWIDGEDMDLEHDDKASQSDEEEPISPLHPERDSEIEMDTGMLGLLKACSGRQDAKERVTRDAEEILKLVRDLGGSVSAYKRERKPAMNGIVSEIYSAPIATKTI